MANPHPNAGHIDFRIEVRVYKLQHLFNSLDLSPFINRDLDREAEAYIIDSIAEPPQARSVEPQIWFNPATNPIPRNRTIQVTYRHESTPKRT